METITPYRRKTHYYETDQMEIIHNSNYFKWFEEARTDFMEQIGLPYNKLEEMGIFAAVISSYCEYKVPITYGEEVVITKRITEFNGYKMTVEYEVLNAADNRLCAIGTTRHCLMSRERKPIRLQKEFPEVYNSLLSWLRPKSD